MKENLYLGQSMEFCRTFTEEDVQKFAELLEGRGPAAFRSKAVVYSSLLGGLLTANIVLSWLSQGILDGLGTMLVQQEMIYLKPIQIGDRIRVRVEINQIEPFHGWVTLVVMASNSLGEDLLRGQVVICTAQAKERGIV